MLGLIYPTYFIFCVCSYIIIFKKILESRRDTQTDMENESSTSSSFMFFWGELKKRGFVIPLFITFTYLLFVVIPAFINASNRTFRGFYDDTVWRISCVLTISDVLIHVFCDKDIRNHLKNTFIKCRRNNQNDDNTTNPTNTFS